MVRCNRPDCGRAVIDEQGFCPECDRRPLDGASPPAQPLGHPGASIGVAQVRPAPWWGLELVDDERGDAAAAPPETEAPVHGVREDHRYCAKCGAAVGRGHDGREGRVEGYCPRCGTRFDFSRSLGGRTIASRYQVERMLGSGGYGAAYLVHDRNLGTEVVLKVLHESVAETARDERNALVGLRHDSIVRILSYEPEGPYLVLEYVPGTRLSARADDPLEVVLAHGLRILQALDYLHARGLLHCDVKPSNIIRFAEPSAFGPRDRVRLIDFGAVRTVGDPRPLVAYTEEFAPPAWNARTGEPDPEHVRPTAGFDLFCLGRTLQELCRRHLRDQRTAPGVDSLDRLLRRATCTEVPARRFVSARQFAEQLSGVIRQVVAAPPAHRQVTRPSVPFGPMTEPLHGGLGAPRPLDHWIEARVAPDSALVIRAPFACPTPLEAVAALPAPLADPDDPHTADSARHALAECRAFLRRGEAGPADQALAAAALPEWDWLRSWYGGLIALARAETGKAADRFGYVRDMLPGELIPLLALGLCAELDGDLTVARMHYERAATTAPGLGAAGFGLARVHLADGRREEAVATAERLAREFRFEREARIAAVRLLVAGPAEPSRDQLARAGELLERLDVDAAARTGMRAEIQLARFVTAGEGLELSEVVRELAGHAATERDHTALVDLANRLRPPIRWRRRAMARKSRRKAHEKHAN